jgi:hypothetical protein
MAFLTVAFFGDWSDLRSWRSGLGGLVDAAYPFPVHLTTMNLVGSRTGQWGAGCLMHGVVSYLYLITHALMKAYMWSVRYFLGKWMILWGGPGHKEAACSIQLL